MTRRRPHILFLLACSALLVAAPADAKPAKRLPAPKVAVGHPVVGTSANGLDPILVPVHYPIELKGRIATLRVALIGARGKAIRSWVLHERLNGGKERLPDRRRRFTFVHRIGLNAELSRQLRRGASVRVLASGRLDIEGDGKAELGSRDVSVGRPLPGPRPKPVCSSVPHLRVKPGARISVPLPICDTRRAWVARKGSRGAARVRAGRLIYKAPSRFRGSDEVELASGGARQVARIVVGTASNPTVRAIGDSVTAGFGYYGATGLEIGLGDLNGCRPVAGETNDACSSNSLAKKSGTGKVPYLKDYGLATGISWAAQWAKRNGVTDYKNFAISGSEPANWAPKGIFYSSITEQMEKEDPDFILLTLGANPLLSKMLFEPEEWACALKGLKEFEECVEKEFEEAKLRESLKSLYTDLVKKTSATIYVMQYHLAVPWSALFDSSIELAAANEMLNREIASVAAGFGGGRLQVISPPHFFVGVELGRFYPSRYTCRFYPVDGRSVQSYKTQDELEGHFLSFCSGPGGGETPWVINNDTGIHPSVTGYSHMAAEVPAP
jgi:lysophospholipase L1-like esterase